MRRKVYASKKKCSYLAGLLLAALFLVCCGSRGRGREEVNSVYTIVGTVDGRMAKSQGGYLYYVRHDAAENEGKDQVVRASLDETGNVRDSQVVFETEENIRSFVPGGDGAVYCLISRAELVKAEGRYEFVSMGAELAKALPDGTEEYRLALDEVKDDLSLSMAVDNAGRVFLLGSRAIYMIDEKGEAAGKLVTDDYFEEAVYGKKLFSESLKGEIYCYVESGVNLLYRVLVQGTSLQLVPADGMSGPANSTGGIIYGTSGGILYNNRTDGILYRYDEEKGAWNGLLRWGDSGLAGEA